MDPRVKEVMESAMQGSQQQVQSIEPLIDSKMGAILDACYSRNSSNSERFAECIMEKNKRVDEIMKSMEYKLLFFSKNANACLTQNRKSVSECSAEAKNGIMEMIDSTKRNIEKL